MVSLTLDEKTTVCKLCYTLGPTNTMEFWRGIDLEK
jgi:hypothetical protein